MYNAGIGDSIGSESCVEIGPEVIAPPPRNRRRCRRKEAAETEYPPPIPWLARTENRPSHMPWVMKRYYSGDGRLVITEERVRHHEYFQVYRSNGRLVLNLVPLNDVVEEEEDQGQKEETEAIGINGDEIDGADGEVSDPTVGELVPRCYTYNNGLGVNTCGGFAAFRPPVHT